MNILHIVFSFNNGGIENLLVDILNNWHTKNDKVYLCIINNNYDPKLLEKISNKNVEIILLKRPVSGPKIKYINKLNNIIKDNAIDIIHGHSNAVLKFCLFTKVIYNTKLIYTVHDTMTYSKLSLIDIFIHKLFIKKIICISKTVYNDVILRYGTSEKIITIYNGVDNRKFDNYEKKKNKKKFRIGCVARLEPPIKGQDVLIKAISILKDNRNDFECWIVGAPPTEKNEYLNELNKLTESLNVTNFIKFIGNSNDVPKLLSTFDIVVVPSIKEGFGISIIEAIFSKVPVIASDIEGPKEIIKDNVYGTLFQVGNYNDLYKKISYLLDHIDRKKVQNAYRYALMEFSISSMIKKLEEVYKSCYR